MFEPNTIYTMKLSSGEEVVTKVVANEPSGYVTISKPVMVVATQQGMQLVPAVFTADPDKSTQLNINSVVMYSKTHIDVANSYIESTTGIKPVGNKILMG